MAIQLLLGAGRLILTRLDLGHGGSTFPDPGGSHVDTRAAAIEEAEEGRGGEAGEGKEQESGGSLCFAAATLCI